LFCANKEKRVSKKTVYIMQMGSIKGNALCNGAEGGRKKEIKSGLRNTKRENRTVENLSKGKVLRGGKAGS